MNTSEKKALKKFLKAVKASDPQGVDQATIVWAGEDEPLRLVSRRHTRIEIFAETFWKECGAPRDGEAPVGAIASTVEHLLSYLEQERGFGAVLRKLSCFGDGADGNPARSIDFSELVADVAAVLAASESGKQPAEKRTAERFYLRVDFIEFAQAAWEKSGRKRDAPSSQSDWADLLKLKDARSVGYWLQPSNPRPIPLLHLGRIAETLKVPKADLLREPPPQITENF